MGDLFPNEPVSVSLNRQIECIEREIRYRRYVYPKRVAAGKLSQAKADDEIAVMEAIVKTLRSLKEKEGAA